MMEATRSFAVLLENVIHIKVLTPSRNDLILNHAYPTYTKVYQEIIFLPLGSNVLHICGPRSRILGLVTICTSTKNQFPILQTGDVSIANN